MVHEHIKTKAKLYGNRGGEVYLILKKMLIKNTDCENIFGSFISVHISDSIRKMILLRESFITSVYKMLLQSKKRKRCNKANKFHNAARSSIVVTDFENEYVYFAHANVTFYAPKFIILGLVWKCYLIFKLQLQFHSVVTKSLEHIFTNSLR